MAIQTGQSGESTRKMERDRALRRVGILVVIAVVGVIGLLLVPRLGKVGGIAGIVVMLVGLVIFKLVMRDLGSAGQKVKKAERRAGRGAAAEEKMVQIFDALPDDCVVYHDIGNNNGNIDHLLISKSKGLFLIETKSHHGEVTAVDGQILINGRPPEKDFIAQTLRNCMWLKQWCKEQLGVDPWVTNVIVFTNGYVRSRGSIKGVWVVNRGYFQKFMERTPANQSAELLWAKRDTFDKLRGTRRGWW